jgi:hypothetical protein
MRQGLGIDVLDCSKCYERLFPVSVIVENDDIAGIQSHLRPPLRPEETDDGAVVYDVTCRATAVVGVACDARGPPSGRGGVDAPSPAE